MSDKPLPPEADLTLFRSQKVSNRRKSPRFRCNLATMAKVRLPNIAGEKVVWAYNLSQGGVGLNSPHPFEVGLDVGIKFKCDHVETETIPAKVIFCRQEADGSWRIGCQFAEAISKDALDGLLG